MKNFTTVKALALSLLCALPLVAKHYDDHNEYRDSDESCCGTPIYACGWNLEIRGGIVPTIWNKRDCFLLANCSTSTTVCNVAQLTPLGGLPKFRSLYKLPWIVGGRLGYGVCDRIEAAIEFDYRSAKAKNDDCGGCFNSFSLCYTTSLTTQGTTTFSFGALSKYKAFEGYVASRWYSDRYWCDSVSFFAGIKVGFVHHKTIDVTITQFNQVGTAVATTVNTFSCSPLYFRNTTISAGGALGFDWCFWNRLSFVFTAEFIGNGPLRANRALGNTACDTCPTNNNNCNTECCSTTSTTTCVPLATAGLSGAGLVGPNFNTEITFPIFFGLKYYF